MAGISRGPYAKTQRRREAIETAAHSLVIERGHGAITIADVAERAKVTEATVTYHFPTKDHLFVGALRADDRATEKLTQKLGDLEHVDIEALLITVTRETSTHPNTLRLRMALGAEAADEAHPAHEYILNRQNSAADYFALLLDAAKANGLAHPDLDRAAVGRQLIALWDGLQAQWLVSPSFDLTQELVRGFRALTLRDVMETRKAMQQFVSQL
ncbi:TetR/AcrR family transcriptional regulator [Streptomyces sp. NPDC004539]|uniref:TetR/AcrR family transcriptional regulator n=1 Tax=Streptomyces sp. NPDC004539 TaxID=3154280 RepID=UPI0033A97980